MYEESATDRVFVSVRHVMRYFRHCNTVMSHLNCQY